MNRRNFLQAAMATTYALGCGLREARAQAASDPGNDPGFDRYGGWKGRRFAASGFFRLEHDDRWWFVTPEGHAYLSFSVNHLHPHWWRQSYNLAHWSDKLGVDPGDASQFQYVLGNYISKEIKSIGFNGLGLHTSVDDPTSIEPRIPYIKEVIFVDIPGWKAGTAELPFFDVYSGQFEAHCYRLAREQVRPLSEDPYLIGYGMTDVPVLTEQDLVQRGSWIGRGEASAATGNWPMVLRNLGPEAPAKHRYVSLMRTVYRDDIGAFNDAYRTDFESFVDLLETDDWRPHGPSSNDAERRDNVVFLRDIVRQYYQTMTRAIRRYDGNHLIFGDKLNAANGSADTVLDIVTRFTDLVFYQIYDEYDVHAAWLDKWSGRIDKPFYNGDSNFVVASEMMPNPAGVVVANQAERASLTREYFSKAFARKDFVGWGWCGLIDTLKTMPQKKYYQHQGIMDPLGNPHRQLQATFRDLAADLYEIGTSGSGE